MKQSKVTQLILSTIAVGFVYAFNVNFCEGAARLIKIPLTRATTKGAGSYGQPIISYYTQINVGTPPSNFNIGFDLDLADHFVPHYNWNPFKRNLHYSNGYQCKASSTCFRTNISATTDYEGCKLTGNLFEDIIRLSNQTIQLRQNFLAATDASDDRFKQLPVDGFFGLSPQRQSTTRITSFVYNLLKNSLIDNLQLSFWFNPDLDSLQGGELLLGGQDPNRYQGQIYWHQLSILSSNWGLNLQQVTLGNYPVGCTGKRCQAILSSGDDSIYGPQNEVEYLYKLLNTKPHDSGIQLVDCAKVSSLPNLFFTIDGYHYQLLPSNYIRKVKAGLIFKDVTCYVTILPQYHAATDWILGTNFLGAYYTTYDITNHQVGFASMRA